MDGAAGVCGRSPLRSGIVQVLRCQPRAWSAAVEDTLATSGGKLSYLRPQSMLSGGVFVH